MPWTKASPPSCGSDEAPTAAPEHRVVYRRQARNLNATAAALNQALKEIEGNLELMQIDSKEVSDVEAMNRLRLDADELRRQALVLRETQLGMAEQVRRAEQLAQAIPAADSAEPPF
ncbi:hypothetical protein [Dankookia sp. P2]|uniref:hypothetical protein n=1 Tax=Dankookia sp. P2 TaxID=3423955 RepID=UPI003D6752D6